MSNRLFMLRKIRKYLTFDASVLVYKQTILPIVDYAGFLLLQATSSPGFNGISMGNQICKSMVLPYGNVRRS